MKIIIESSIIEAAKSVANLIAEQIKKKPRSSIGLAAGSTMIPLYKQLTKFNKSISFNKIKTFNLDEYINLSLENKNSFHYFMNRYLFKNTDINPENINFPLNPGLYEKKLKLSPIDLQVLGIGINGHIGFNEPGSSFISRTRIVRLSDSTRKKNFKSFPKKVPKKAITMGILSIMNAKKIILLATGKSKAKIIKKTIQSPISTKTPGSVLRKHKNTTIILDKQAASLLS